MHSKILAVNSRYRKLVRSSVVRGLLGKSLNNNRLAKLVAAVVAELEPTPNHGAVYDSACYLLGETATAPVLQAFLKRMSANHLSLAAGKAVRPWSRQQADEWVCAQVVEAKTIKLEHRGLRVVLSVKALTGTVVGQQMTVYWSIKQLRYFANQLGFSRKEKVNRFFFDARELVGFYLQVQVSSSLSVDKPTFKEIRITAADLKENVDLIESRKRSVDSGFVCPENYPVTHPCFRCPVGYDQCEIGTHPRTYVIVNCKVCDKKQYADPQAKSVCVNCEAEGKNNAGS